MNNANFTSRGAALQGGAMPTEGYATIEDARTAHSQLGQRGANIAKGAQGAQGPTVAETYLHMLDQIRYVLQDVKDSQICLIERMNGATPQSPTNAGVKDSPAGAFVQIEERLRWLTELANGIQERQNILARVA